MMEQQPDRVFKQPQTRSAAVYRRRDRSYVERVLDPLLPSCKLLGTRHASQGHPRGRARGPLRLRTTKMLRSPTRARLLCGPECRYMLRSSGSMDPLDLPGYVEPRKAS